jgi:hypothetical protein
MDEEIEPQRTFKGVWIEAAIWLSEEICPLAKMMLAEIDALDDGEGCFASDKWFAKQFRVSERRITQMMTALRQLKLVKTLKFNGRRRWIRSVFWRSKELSRTEIYFGAGPKYISGQDRNIFRTESTSINNKNNHAGHSPRGCVFPSLNGDTPKAVSLFAELTIKNRWQVGQKGASRHGWKVSTIQKWVRSYYQLLEQLGGDKKNKRQITELVEWYADHYKDQFIPEARNFTSFVEKYMRIKSAMQRAEGIDEEDEQEPKIISEIISPEEAAKYDKWDEDIDDERRANARNKRR